MGWKQWSAVAAVIGGGILLQIPAHDDAEMDHGAMDHGAIEQGDVPPDVSATQGSIRTVALAVTGMT